MIRAVLDASPIKLLSQLRELHYSERTRSVNFSTAALRLHLNTGLVIGPFRAAAPQKFSRGFIMAWRSHGATNKELVEKLASNGLIKSDRVKQAMLRVDTIIKNDG